MNEVASNNNLNIELINITKKFKDVIAVNNINLKIKRGEFFSLLGPSGCGKTTTLRIIAGLESPTAGKVFLEKKDVTSVPAYKRNVNTVFQDYAIFPHMNIIDNIYFPLKMRNINKRIALPKIEKVLKFVNMSGYGNRYSHQLSGGQRQRIALARAIINEPKALLLDEPLGALDFKLRVAMQKVLKEIQKNLGITFVYVTHDQTEAITMSDRIAVMRDGIIHQIGTPSDIYNTPSTPFVASFIGEMNFIQGEVIESSIENIKVKVGNFRVYCRKSEYNINKGEKVLICVRPDKVFVTPSKKSINKLNLKLIRVVFRGDNYETTFALGDSELYSIISGKDWNGSFKVGSNLEIGWESEDSTIYPMKMAKDLVNY